ncbi:MAG TPA: hypothetical protein VNS09_17500 [Solirubrobacter sp.]|nr:hypothetical protein [Solirubrobacter sp.]
MTTAPYTDGRARRGVSLAKGPIGLLGLVSLIFGVLGFIFASRNFSIDFPRGTVNGTTFLGIEGNGWTWVAFAAAGVLLLLGSPVHWGAKSMAFIVGLVLVVGALIGLSDGNDVLGVVAVNDWTVLAFGAGGLLAIVLAMLPRVGGGGGVPVAEDRRGGRFRRTRTTTEREPVAHGGALDDRP